MIYITFCFLCTVHSTRQFVSTYFDSPGLTQHSLDPLQAEKVTHESKVLKDILQRLISGNVVARIF